MSVPGIRVRINENALTHPGHTTITVDQDGRVLTALKDNVNAQMSVTRIVSE